MKNSWRKAVAWVKRCAAYLVACSICGGLWLGWKTAIISFPSDYFGGGGYEMHVIGGGATTLFFAAGVMATHEEFGSVSRRFYVVTGIWPTLLLTIDELLQVFEPWRTVEFWDGAAQVIGIALGIGFIHLWENRWRWRKRTMQMA